MNYELIEHTADVGIRVKAADLAGLFADTASAMFEIISEKQQEEKKPQKINIEQKADTLEELLINWLNELLSLSAAKELIFSEFQIEKIDKNNLKAIASGSAAKSYKVNVEIKAATYHALKLEKTGSGWIAEVIFDV